MIEDDLSSMVELAQVNGSCSRPTTRGTV